MTDALLSCPAPAQTRVAMGAGYANIWRQHQAAIYAILRQYEPEHVVVDEWQRSLKTLDGLEQEAAYLSGAQVPKIASFLPLNLPLYSMVLFGIVPSLLAQTIAVRPPVLMRPILAALVDLLGREGFPRNLQLLDCERRAFLRDYVADADVVIFTGQYANAVEIHRACKAQSLFLLNGAGVNPFIIAPGATTLAIEKVVATRLFNSGQDCAGPDLIWVHRALLPAVLAGLQASLALVRVGVLGDPRVDVGPLYDDQTVRRVQSWLAKYEHCLIYGPPISEQRRLAGERLLVPTVFLHEAKALPPNEEVFAPIFNLVAYDTEADLFAYFGSADYQNLAMYVSVFGEVSAAVRGVLREVSIVLENQSILDVEDGNQPFGGWGRHSSFAAVGQSLVSCPILISQQISAWHAAQEAL